MSASSTHRVACQRLSLHLPVSQTRGHATSVAIAHRNLCVSVVGTIFPSPSCCASRPAAGDCSTWVLVTVVLLTGEDRIMTAFDEGLGGLSALFEETCMSGAAPTAAHMDGDCSSVAGGPADHPGQGETPQKKRLGEDSGASVASSGLLDSPATAKRQLTDEEKERKVCIACGFKITEKSPLCRDELREWPPAFDCYGDMCRYCWSLMRVRFTNQTPASMPQFLANPENKTQFELYLLSWFSLKMDGTCARITCQALEARSRLITMLRQWAQAGRSMGLPAWSPPAITRLLAEHMADQTSNPLLQGGTIVQMLSSEGHLRAGIRMPQSAAPQSDLPKFRILDPSSPHFAADVQSVHTGHSIIDDTNMHVTVEEDQQMAQGMIAEWRAVRAAERSR